MVLQRHAICEGCQKDFSSYPCMVFDDEFESIFEDQNETLLRSQLNDLHTRIIRELYDVPVTSRDYPEPWSGCAYYTRDGFMPGYSTAPKRILFIARESRWSDPDTLDPKELRSDVIKNTYMRFREDKTRLFERRMVSIAAQFLSLGKFSSYDEMINDNWSSVRNAVKKGEITFAYLELSKFANCNESSSVDWLLMNRYADFDATYSFGKQQIELLKPDIIITTNLMKQFSKSLQVMLGSELVEFDLNNEINKGSSTSRWNPNLTIKKVQAPWDSSQFIPVLDMWHFSARKKHAVFFDSIKNVLIKWNL
ncbi:MAG TPA: hypothetical protein PLD69_02555 [Sphaerochaeta sp.]|nr:hypothetical protein [Sphaerochaeta sp.]HQB04803.1 hypothetical protein [Sphaerochaeta sp.]